MKGKAVSRMMLSVLIICVLGLAFDPEPASSSEIYSTQKAPDFTLTDIYGKNFSLYKYSGRVVLVEFFATWASPCVKQISPLKNIYSNYSRDQLEMISISFESEVVLRDFADEYDIDWIVARDIIDLFDQYAVYAVPTSFIIDSQHYIRYEHVGLTEESTLRSEIDSLLPKTIYVDDDNTEGPWDGTPEHPYQNITSALQHVAANDTIFVCNGTYNEQITIYQPLKLIGESKSNTIIDGIGYTVIKIYADNVTVSGFTVRNGGWSELYAYGSCIYLGYGKKSCIISNNMVSNSSYGVASDYGKGNTVYGNTFLDTETGIRLYRSNNNIIEDNVISNSTWGGPYWGGGIYLDYSYNNTVAGNIISNTTEVGIWLNSYSNIVVDNTVSDTTEPAIFLEHYGHDNIVMDNTVSDSQHSGIYIQWSSYNNTIVGNVISNNSYNGILVWGPNNRIIGNVVANVVVGIRLNSFIDHPDSCVNNIVSRNVVFNSNWGMAVGFDVPDALGGSFNTVAGNNFSNNHCGITLFSSNHTKIFHNNFIKNVNQAIVSQSFNTTWDDDYPSGGNYWSDYTDVDLYCGPSQDIAASDGIWDHPYVINASNQDNYPLVKPYLLGNLSVSIYLDKYTYYIGDTMHLGLNVTNPDGVKYLCFAVWVELPDSSIHLYMHKHSVVLPLGLNYANPSFESITLPSLPQGNYTWHAAFLERATHTIMVEDTAEWEFA